KRIKTSSTTAEKTTSTTSARPSSRRKWKSTLKTKSERPEARWRSVSAERALSLRPLLLLLLQRGAPSSRGQCIPLEVVNSAFSTNTWKRRAGERESRREGERERGREGERGRNLLVFWPGS
ncbi:hypothetical protein KUCAC02_036085, partial [Chaenocephalus aceratus]